MVYSVGGNPGKGARRIGMYTKKGDHLQESEERDFVFENASEGIFQIAPDGRYRSTNPAFARMHGYGSFQEIIKIGSDLVERLYVHPADHVRFREILEAKCFVRDYETEHYRKDGSRMRVSSTARTVRDETGKTLYYEGILREIAGHDRMEEALNEERRIFRMVLEHNPTGVALIGSNGKYLYTNPEFTRITGYTLQDIPSGQEWFRKAYPDPACRRRAADAWKQDGLAYTGDAIDREFSITRKDGETVVVNIRTTFLKDLSIMVLTDVTERKQAEEALRQSERKFRDIAELMPQVVYEIDNNARLTFANKEAFRNFGITEDEYNDGINVFDIFPPDEHPRIRQNMEKVVREGPTHDNEYTIVKKDGGLAPVLIYSAPILKDGEHVGFRGILIDITELKRAEESLREGEAKYRTLFESANDAIFLLKNNLCVDCNSRASMMFGCAKDRLVGAASFGFWPPCQPDGADSTDGAHKKMDAALDKGPQFFEWRHCKLDGTVFDTEVSLSAVTIGGEVLLQAIVRDIAERKNLEAQLLQAQKMEAIGTLAGGIAHDFNNILMAMMGYMGLIAAKVHEDFELRNYVNQIQACTNRASNLTRGLLAFSRKQAVELRPQSTNAILTDCEKLLRRLVPEDVEFVLSLDDEVTIMADVTQIDQVLMNLITNAKDAMPKGGTLRIETKLADIGREFKQTHGFGEPGRYALVSVSDTGTGMDEATQKKIFEPFFTTKESGRGTGLGLSIVYGIVKQHNGYITVSSKPEAGTTFDIYFPAVKASVPEADPTDDDLQGGSECLLLAEDDDFVREITAEILTTCGYTVVEAKDGEDAIRKYAESRDSIDLLLLDVVMPVKNGKQVYDEIRKNNPSVRVLFMSGYTGDVVLDKGIQDTAIDYVSKPLSTPELLKKIREVLKR